jgi:hypothetical protein
MNSDDFKDNYDTEEMDQFLSAMENWTAPPPPPQLQEQAPQIPPIQIQQSADVEMLETSPAFANKKSGVAEFEIRACVMCSKKKIRCDLTMRPCRPCVENGTEAECLEDASVVRRACEICRKTKRSCDKSRPCGRCAAKGLGDQCHSFIPKAFRTNSVRVDMRLDSNGMNPVFRQDSPLNKLARSVSSNSSNGPNNADIADHFLLANSITLFNVTANFTILYDFVMKTATPEMIFNALSCSEKRFDCFLQCISSFLTSSATLRFFLFLLGIVSKTVDPMTIVEKVNVEERINRIGKFTSTLAKGQTNGSALSRINDWSLPGFSMNRARLSASEQEIITAFVDTFQASLPADQSSATPALFVNKNHFDSLNKVKTLQVYINKQAENLMGYSLDELTALLSAREWRDTVWITNMTESWFDPAIHGIAPAIFK